MEGESITDVVYGECCRNHAADLGKYATDGCREFVASLDYPFSLLCEACHCHRAFHRKLVTRGSNQEAATATMDYSVESGSGKQTPESPERSSKKMLRIEFSPDQEEKMLAFADKLGWKLQSKDKEAEVNKFCGSIGLSRKVFEAWMMHNRKNSASTSASAPGYVSSSLAQ